MKQSRYNTYHEKGSLRIVANTMSRAVVEVDETHWQALRSNAFDTIDASVPALITENIIVDDSLDELALLRYAYNQAKYDPRTARVLVCPTLDCNFRCPYCYESRQKGEMSEEVQQGVVKYIASLAELGTERVEVTWYGGEPLLQPKLIESLSSEIADACHANGMKIAFSVITNGYLLNEGCVTMLKALGVSHIQVTLDGDRDTHNSRRFLSDGAGTFDRILDNIEIAHKNGISVSVRVNIDRTNMDAYEKVKAALGSILNDGHVRCYPAVVTEAEAQGEVQKRRCHSHEEYAQFYKDIGTSAFLSNGLDSIPLTIGGCGAEHCTSSVIDPEGFIYKCWNDVGIKDMAFSSVVDSEFINPTPQARYMGRDPFSEDACCTCPYIPLCLGGCSWELHHNRTHACSSDRYLFDQQLQEDYFFQHDDDAQLRGGEK